MSTKKGAKARPDWDDAEDGFYKSCRYFHDEGDDKVRCGARSLAVVDRIEGRDMVECPCECENYRKEVMHGH